MIPEAKGLLPEDVVHDLLARWTESHRFYHGVSHLVHGLEALDSLGGTREERIAFWFHDAVHSNSTPEDEQDSATLVEKLLSGHENTANILEIQRLVLLTAGHHTDSNDESGQRVCDADLSGLGSDAILYRRNVAGIRAEMPHLTEQEWVAGRSAFLSRFLRREHLFATELGRERWETVARINLQNELHNLLSGTAGNHGTA